MVPSRFMVQASSLTKLDAPFEHWAKKSTWVGDCLDWLGIPFDASSSSVINAV